ncbi:hypothetical protein Avbf_11799, partial [Armadillidium vulgare]
MTRSVKLLEQKLHNINIIQLCTGEQNKNPLQRNNFQIDFTPKLWNRKTCEELEKEIENVWNKKLQTCKVYNGQKFRYAGNEVDKDVFKLNLGMTCYRDIIGISQSQNVDKWKTMGEENFGNSQAYLSNVSIFQKKWSIDTYLPFCNNFSYIALCSKINTYTCIYLHKGVRKECWEKINEILKSKCRWLKKEIIIWNSPVDELIEEVGVSSDQIESPKLLGIVQNLSLSGRPSLEFLTRSDDTEVFKDCSAIMKPQNYTPALRGALIMWSHIN